MVANLRPSAAPAYQLPKRFALVSGDNPRWPVKATKPIDEALSADICLPFAKVAGVYAGEVENSYLVNLDGRAALENELIALAREYGQESILFSRDGHNALIYTHAERSPVLGFGVSVEASTFNAIAYTVLPDGSILNCRLDF